MAGAKLAVSAARVLGVVAEAKNGRGRLLDRAIDLFYASGFHSVGLDNILDAAGVTKTTFYKHFDSLEDLMVAAVERRHRWEGEAWERAISEAAGGDDRRRFVAMFDLMDRWFNEPEFRGCLFINVAAEFPDPDDPVHRAAAAYKKAQRDAWRDLAARLGSADAEAFADGFSVLVEGTLILRHVHGRNDAARVSRPLAEALVDHHVPRRAGGAGVPARKRSPRGLSGARAVTART
jgi:AcrR family transcriptional regulator